MAGHLIIHATVTKHSPLVRLRPSHCDSFSITTAVRALINCLRDASILSQDNILALVFYTTSSLALRDRPPIMARKTNIATLLACPFYMRDPTEHAQCQNVSLTKMSFVKQHLNRKHRGPPYCERCGMDFRSEDELLAHLSSAEICLIQRPLEGLRGMTKYQEAMLLMRSKHKLQADEQWYEVFRHLLPGEQPPPSPYALAKGRPDGTLALAARSLPSQSPAPSDVAGTHPSVALQGMSVPQPNDELSEREYRVDSTLQAIWDDAMNERLHSQEYNKVAVLLIR